MHTEIKQGTDTMNEVQNSIPAAESTTIDIEYAANLIQEITEQLNLLSLNASIETLTQDNAQAIKEVALSRLMKETGPFRFTFLKEAKAARDMDGNA